MVRWEILPDAEGYVVRHGIAPSKLYHNLVICCRTEIVPNDLNAEAGDYCAVDALAIPAVCWEPPNRKAATIVRLAAGMILVRTYFLTSLNPSLTC
jgi:hypothetical protein